MSAITKRLDDAISFINTSREELKQGNVVNLEGFQDEVASLCSEIANNPVGDMKSLSDRLTALGEGLAALEDELKAQQQEVQQEILDLNRKQKALKSYESAGHSDKKEDGNP